MRTYPEGVRFCSIDGRDLHEVDSDPLVGEVIDGRYRIVRALGHGGMGRVYYSEHAKLNKPFALKFLLGDLTQNPEMVKRFQREANSSSRLNHPHCVSTVDFGETSNGLLYLAMEYLEGQDLAKVMRKDGPLNPKRAAKIARQICEGLAEAHSLGIVHRDLKPENIMLVRRGDDPDFVKILDFGLAKILEQNPEENGGTALTSMGIVHGTPPYMSPEQANGDTLDGRSDLYSLGVILFQMCTNRLPFEKPSAMEVMLAHVRQKPPMPRSLRPDLPISIEAMILRALEKDRNARFADAREMARSLQQADEATEMLSGNMLAQMAKQNQQQSRPVLKTPVISTRPASVQEAAVQRNQNRTPAPPISSANRGAPMTEDSYGLGSQDEIATIMNPNLQPVPAPITPRPNPNAPPSVIIADTKTNPDPSPFLLPPQPKTPLSPAVLAAGAGLALLMLVALLYLFSSVG